VRSTEVSGAQVCDRSGIPVPSPQPLRLLPRLPGPGKLQTTPERQQVKQKGPGSAAGPKSGAEQPSEV